MLAALAVPILAAKCLACHNAEAKTGGLDLSPREALMAGGKSGAAIVAGKAAESRLYQYVSAKKMPPGKPLDAGEIEALRAWIDEGANYGGQKFSLTAHEGGARLVVLQSLPKPRTRPRTPPIQSMRSCSRSCARRGSGLLRAPIIVR
ncbi:MAG: c-type cytochrome domain-containing protein [Bryobacteraceae bacterium]